MAEDNRPREECQRCPISVNNEKCPLSPSGEPLCWNKEHCQKGESKTKINTLVRVEGATL
ncbi:hypothetical protein RUM43_004369 [Polyplax serrata]|uniref:Uncharacterized protein n=1 Tax=Polyplax serrata TaxID=468196 RepID=A0AAN8XPS0_POLSC